MAWWKRFFKKKTEPVEEDDWEQLVYTRNGVNFEEEDQRKRYIVNCLEQIAEASREIDLLTGEYTLVTSYLTDMEEIEALPAQQRGEINRTAGKISALFFFTGYAVFRRYADRQLKRFFLPRGRNA